MLGAGGYQDRQAEQKSEQRAQKSVTERQLLKDCRQIMLRLATAEEMFASDHGGSYTENLEELQKGNYAKFIVCPTGTAYSYEPYRYKGNQRENVFRIWCTGDHTSTGVESGLPSYDAEKGLNPGREVEGATNDR